MSSYREENGEYFVHTPIALFVKSNDFLRHYERVILFVFYHYISSCNLNGISIHKRKHITARNAVNHELLAAGAFPVDQVAWLRIGIAHKRMNGRTAFVGS